MILTNAKGDPYDISSVTGGSTVAPSDINDLPKGPTKALFVAATGNVKVDMADGSTVILTALNGGMIHSISVRRIHATGTTATGIVALY